MSRWLQVEGLAASTLDAAVSDAILREWRAAGYPAGLARSSPRPLLEYLRAVGVMPPEPVAVPGAVDAPLARYAGYLARERGLAKGTTRRNLPAARAFLAGRQVDTRLELETLTVGDVTAFVLELSRQQPGSLPRTVTALRSLLRFLLRFLHLDGAVGAGPGSGSTTSTGAGGRSPWWARATGTSGSGCPPTSAR